MQSTAVRKEVTDSPDLIVGKAPIVRILYEGGDLSPLWQSLLARLSRNPGDAPAFLDASTILHAIGEGEKAAINERAALDIARTFRIRNGRGTGPDILVFATGGDFMANTPIEFLLERSDTNLLLHYVDANTPNLDDVPQHDVAFVAIGESAGNAAALDNLERLLIGWDGPIMNNAPRRISALSRDGVAKLFCDEPAIVAPATVRTPRELVERLASKEIPIDPILPAQSYPLVIRPAGTHAGKGMQKIAGPAELGAYVQAQPENEFYVAPFIDYRGSDGKFRKQRIAFIDGKAYASHLAVSDHWMVHYLSAGMLEHEDRRAEEALWMASFDSDFALRHADAFETLNRRLGLDYFAIDCAELSDGRLLLFEADVAMIVHSLDPEKVFPYKKEPMSRLFTAFEAALAKRAARGSASALQDAGRAVR